MPWLCVGDLMLQPNGGLLQITPKPLDPEHDRVIMLTPLEAGVMWYLMSYAGQLITIEELAKQVWGASPYVLIDDTIRVCIKKLRDKVELDPTHPVYIRTRWRSCGRSHRMCGYLVPLPGQNWPRIRIGGTPVWS